MKYYILTGTTRGLGKALTFALTKKGNHLVTLSRSENEVLKSYEKYKDVSHTEILVDLNDMEALKNAMEKVFSVIPDTAEGVYLVNNAGTVQPMKPIEDCTADEIARSYQVNTVAPVALTAAFIRHTQQFDCDKKIVNISSGAGKKPYEGWSCYCGTKAAIDSFTGAVAKEQMHQEKPVGIVSFAPGVIDTGMQAEIRASKKSDFPNLERFIALKDNGELLRPEQVANVVIDLLHGSGFVQGGILDIRTLEV
ncbi:MULTISPECIES: (S)-benzoin forming benzil reductase [unclassified Fusibacter]|uniref:(S)-benzoin forming benzil reductase n=1 Tax=unclassified Fusibacter TaxID=2624464 RepID=UPI00101110ED|nr:MULTISPECIES: (S)-benzoin forming benzil reductase [unclassified Fusibacter]MCK8061171.1 (S)-benzoin forming benzil reductase [Fusibacter sp. A2]NPE23292.1 (S)-benzoin forming benzil reductase [Fusibacter sp. A1]RXV59334.1 (S)-benzoin forming benzil reductase [Fusibacter sp. A1]